MNQIDYFSYMAMAEKHNLMFINTQIKIIAVDISNPKQMRLDLSRDIPVSGHSKVISIDREEQFLYYYNEFDAVFRRKKIVDNPQWQDDLEL